ncbi:amidohydrolase family protein [uncultured Jatrophihabitans sp.]|uniref:amidohydrolase family protein n=1 Tax=uncultured Jatrophihabitans sp. TaxID=1610747 RepID=UPI0035C9F84D
MTRYVPDADYLPFDPAPSKPDFVLPPGSVDVHTHVFGPGDVFPYAPERKYTPVDAPKETLFAREDFLGVDRTVIVQATCHGADNRALVDALQTAGDRARGIATVRDDVTYDALAQLHEAGVRGVRFNFVRRLVDPKPDAYYRAIAERIANYGWHIVAYFEPADLAERWELFTTLPTDLVVDHMGRPDVTHSPDGPEFERFRSLLRDHPQVWVKVTCPDRLTRTGPPYDDVIPFAAALVGEFGDRVLWGTDWPHPNLKSHMPDDGQLVDLVPRVTGDPAAQHAWLVDNPERLYWR